MVVNQNSKYYPSYSFPVVHKSKQLQCRNNGLSGELRWEIKSEIQSNPIIVNNTYFRERCGSIHMAGLVRFVHMC